MTAIGDSVLESADPALRQVFPFLTVDADVGRQANEVFDEIAWLQLGGRLGQIVVIEAGVERHRRAPTSSTDLLTKLSDRRRVVLVTVHAPRVWQDLNNAIFAAGRARRTRTRPWRTGTRPRSEHPEWLYPDGTHVRPEYAYEYARDRQDGRVRARCRRRG